MAVQQKKVSKARRDKRRAHHALKSPSYVVDQDSGEYRRPHHVDLKTGMYKGREVLPPKDEG